MSCIPVPPRAGKAPPFRPSGSPALPLLAALALVVLAVVNLRAASNPGLLHALQASPLTLLPSVLAPLLLALGVLGLMMKNGKHLCDRPNLLPEMAAPWH